MNTALSKEIAVKIDKYREPTIYHALAFEKRIIPFKPWEIRFLDCLNRGLGFEEAIASLGISQEKANRLLKGPRAKAYLEDLVREQMAAQGWTPAKWVNEVTKVWSGEKPATREQMQAITILGNRIAPVKDKEASKAPVININIGALEEAARRIEVTQTNVVDVQEVPSAADEQS